MFPYSIIFIKNQCMIQRIIVAVIAVMLVEQYLANYRNAHFELCNLNDLSSHFLCFPLFSALEHSCSNHKLYMTCWEWQFGRRVVCLDFVHIFVVWSLWTWMVDINERLGRRPLNAILRVSSALKGKFYVKGMVSLGPETFVVSLCC